MAKPRSYTPDKNAPLTELLRKGDIDAFETLVLKYVKRMYDLVYLLSGDAAIATGASRNAFVAAWREVNSLRSTMYFSTWMVSLLLREYRKLTELGEGGRSRRDEPGVPPGDGADRGGEGESSLQESLRRYIRSMAPEQTMVLVLHYVRGYRLVRMAEILQIREDVLLTRLVAAQEQLITMVKQGMGSPLRQGGEFRRHHEEIRRGFPAYLDSSAEEKEKDSIRRHLGECGSCREALAELEWIAEHLKSLPDSDPPAGLVPAIMAAVRAGTPPLPPAQPVYNPLSQEKWVIVALILAAVALYWYLAPHETAPVPEVKSPPPGEVGVPAKARSDRGTTERGGGSIIPPLQVRGGDSSAAGRAAPVRPEGTVGPVTIPPAVPAPLPTGAVPSVPPRQSVPAIPLQPVKPTVEASPALPSDWGDIPPAGRTPPKKAAPRGPNGAMSVLLGVTDRDRSLGEIERAVTALDGSITGRGYSGGRDLLYARIDVENVMALMGRLGKIGTVLELPHIPEDATGPIDLVISW